MENIENELKQLKVDKDNPIGSSDVDPDLTLMDNLKKAKKEEKALKKKKKKEKASPLAKKLDSIIGDVGPAADEDALSLTEMAKNIKKNSKRKGRGIDFDTDGFMDSDGSKRKKKKNTLKKFEEQFAPETSLLKALLKEANDNSGAINKAFKDLCGAKVRGVSKAMTDLAATLVSSNGNRLQIIKALADLKKTANDLAIKEDSRKKDTDGDGPIDQEAMGASFMQTLFSKGNREFTASLADTTAMSEDEFESLQQRAGGSKPRHITEVRTEPTIDKGGNEDVNTEDDGEEAVVPQAPFDPDIDENLAKLEEEYKDNPIYSRSEAGGKLIEHEADGVKIKIKRWIDEDGNTDWEYVAINKYGDEVLDYEVPSKKKTHPMKWTEDTGLATDRFGRTYEIIDLGSI